jgi:hypothetical protein
VNLRKQTFDESICVGELIEGKFNSILGIVAWSPDDFIRPERQVRRNRQANLAGTR